MYDLIIAGGRVVDEGGVAVRDVAVSGERIASVAPRIADPCIRRINAEGFVLLPGLIDPHVHFHLPMKGTVSSDDPDSGTAAALFGGVTTVIDFTVQRPGRSLPESLAERLADFEGRAYCDYALHVSVTHFGAGFEGRLGEDLDKIAGRGVTSLKVFTCYSRDGIAIAPEHLRTLLSQADARGLLVLVHAEDDATLNAALDGLVAAGRVAPKDYPMSRPAEAEARAVSGVIEAARETDAAVYFVHVSTARGADAILEGRRHSDRPIYFETCPQYLLLDDCAYAGPDGPQYMVAPPLRKPSDRAALLEAIRGGHVDVVATDHCPFRRCQKDLPGAPFPDIPNGLPGVETRLPLLHTAAVVPGLIKLEELARLTATGPARVFGLYPRKGCIRPGSDADLVLFDPQTEWTIEPAVLHMNTDFSPYRGFRARGKVSTVLLRGQVVIENGDLKMAGAGRFVEGGQKRDIRR